MPKSTAVVSPNLGLYIARPNLAVPDRALQDGLNFRIREGRIESFGLGWTRFGAFQLNGRVRLVDNFFPKNGTDQLIFGTERDIYVYADGGVSFLTPRYGVGTVTIAGAVVTFSETDVDDFLKAGDMIAFGTAGVVDPDYANWYEVESVDSGTQVTLTETYVAAPPVVQTTVAPEVMAAGAFGAYGTTIAVDVPVSGTTFTKQDATMIAYLIDGDVIRVCLDDTTRGVDAGDAASVDRSEFDTLDDGVLTNTNPAMGMSFDLYIPTLLPDPTDLANVTLAQVRQAGVGSPLQIVWRVSNGSISVRTEIGGTVYTSILAAGTFKGRWVHFDINGVWTDEATGQITVHVDGVLKYSRLDQANCPNDTSEIYMKFGLYRPDSDSMAVRSPLNVFFNGLDTRAAFTGAAYESFTARKLFTMDANDWWDTAIFVDAAGQDDQWIATNGTDWVVSWNGSDAQVVEHPEMNFRARALANYKNMIVYGNIVTGGEILATQIINSDVGSPFNAGDTGTGLSEQFTIHGGSDPILALVPLNDSLVGYSERHVVPIDFIGDPEVFSFRISAVDYGPIGPKAIANFADHHIFVGPDALYHFDGVAHQEVDMHIWPELIRTHDPVRRLSIFCFFVEEFAELVWSVPLTTDSGSGSIEAPGRLAHVAAYIEPTGLPKDSMAYSRRSFPFTAAGRWTQESGVRWSDLTMPWSELAFRWNDQALSAGYPLTIVGDADGYIYSLNSAQTGDGEILPSFVRMARKAIVDGKARGLMRRFYPFLEARSGDLDVTLRFADHAQGTADIIHTDAFDMALPAESHFTSPFRRGRYVEFEVGSALGLPWSLAGYDFDAQPGGRR